MQEIIDQLMYNQVWAPNYPERDRTSLEQEETLIGEKLVQAALDGPKREDVGNWVRLGRQSIAAAFENYRKGDEGSACKCLDSAIQYFRNAISKKKLKATFIAGQGGPAKPAP